MKIKAYHKDLGSLHIGCENPRSYYIPYESSASALKGERTESEFFTSLNGEWNFKFYSSYEDFDFDFLYNDFFDKITVPKCWQTELNKGYDVPLYSNLWYPYPVDPPYLPVDNPCGHYNRAVVINKKPNKKYYLNFEGVSSCFYLFVNKKFTAYSQVSHATTEVDITEHINNGENYIDVLVVKWCDGSYLEDQDMFRLSGIFRDVFILERDDNFVGDIWVKTNLNDDLSKAEIVIETVADEIKYRLFDKDCNVILTDVGYTFTIDSPKLWSSENPEYYILVLHIGSEYIPFILALKKLEFRGNIAYFNNEPIKLYGVNRHDNNPTTGYYTSVEDMKEDIFICKRANVNTIRTSHYPNSPLFYDLCIKYGIMVVNEADIETHGMGFEYKDTWDWFRWSKLSTDDEWEASYVDRAKLLFERDKNFGCVIMWSLGNESGCGKNHRAMRNYIKSRDKKAIIHYENSHLEFKAVPIGENFSDISDVESRMYSSLEYTEEYAKNPSAKKPFYWCEFSCANTTGDIHAHADLIRKYSVIFGGCFWELTDHAIDIGDGKFRYGGDFGDFPNNDICCIDGVTFPNRTLKPGYFDLKKAYEPFECRFDNQTLNIFNRRYFTDLNDMYVICELEVNGAVLESTLIQDLDILPQSSKDFEIEFDIPDGDCVFLNIYFKSKFPTPWCSDGYEYGFNQFDLSNCETQEDIIYCDKPEFIEEYRYITINAGDVTYVLDKPYAKIVSAHYEETHLFNAPLDIEIWKAPGSNELDKAKEWKSAGMECSQVIPKSLSITETPKSIIVTSKISIGGPAVVPIINGEISYEFFGNGKVKVCFNGEMNPLLEKMQLGLPRFGFRFTLPKEFSNAIYFGKGPHESYADRHRSTRYGRFFTTARENFVPYIKPVENGAHFGTREAAVFNDEGISIRFLPESDKSFIFNLSHFTPKYLEKTLHYDELIEDDNTYVYLDYKISLKGGVGLYEILEPERKWEFGKIYFAVSFLPFIKE